MERLSFNHEAIVSFAARGSGTKGSPQYGAPLSDPNAVPNDDVKGAVDAVLRVVSLALLEGVDSVNEEMSSVANAIINEGGSGHTEGVTLSLAYLRDRVGGELLSVFFIRQCIRDNI